jgi:hypothetical protein
MGGSSARAKSEQSDKFFLPGDAFSPQAKRKACRDI